jgi:hypothetical protein
VPAALGLVVIAKGAAGMDLGVVRQQLDVAGPQRHFEAHVGAVGDLVVAIEQPFGVRVELGHLGVSAHLAEVVGVVKGTKLAVGVAARGHRKETQAALGLGVEVERLEQFQGELRIGGEHLVEDGDGAGDAALAATGGGAQAQEAHGVRGVAVKRDVLAGAVGAHADVVDRQALVAHVAEQVAGGILSAGDAQVKA